jgi:hypothetical protein
MRNVFDQYTQPENRLTHALLVSLEADPRLLMAFVHWVTGQRRLSRNLAVHEQAFPDDVDPDSDGGEGRGIPDGCISDGSGWALLIESKLADRWIPDQLRRHRVSATRHGLIDCTILILTVGRSSQAVPERCLARTWSDVYAWLQRHAGEADWARRCQQYFEVFEAQLAEINGLAGGTITMFAGIPFGKVSPYSYLQAKRLLGLLRTNLIEDPTLRHALHVDPGNPGRGAITGASARFVWDYIGLVGARGVGFTQYPHLTLGILDDRLEAMLTVPNSVPAKRRRAILGDTFARFEQRIAAVVSRIAAAHAIAPGLRPVVTVMQRHYPSQRSEPISDAILRFDPRTAVAVRSGGDGSVKHQAQWLEVTHEVLENRNANVQFQIGAEFPYATCEAVRSAKIANAVSAVWRACAPMLAELTASAR